MARRLPSLNSLRAFESAARLESFTLAAAEMNVSHAAVSRHIRELEGWLGAKLFHRTGRGVALTDDGAQLGRELTPAFDRLAEATERFANPARRRELVISSEIPFAALWLVPRLGRFTARHPDVDLVLDPSNSLVDFSKNEADIGIRFGGGVWVGVDALALCESFATPVCSPALLGAKGVASPRDLDGATLIREDTKEHWQAWLSAAGVADRVAATGPVFKGHLAIAAAESGQGFALADDIMAGEALLAGRLVSPFETRIRAQGYYLVRGAGAKECHAVAAFRTWLTGELAELATALAALRAKDGEKSQPASGPRRGRR